MATSSHEEMRRFLAEAAAGRMPANKHMVFNPQNGKFEVRTAGERPGDIVPQVDAEDMKAFGPRRRP